MILLILNLKSCSFRVIPMLQAVGYEFGTVSFWEWKSITLTFVHTRTNSCYSHRSRNKIKCLRSKMSQKAYEDACLRAELFGQPKPEKEEFLAKHKHLDIVEFEEVDIKTATENTAMLDEDIRATDGAIGELNTILSSTQTKINKLKGVCGSLTSFFRVKLTGKDNLSYSSEPSYVGQTNYDKDYIPPQNKSDEGSINHGLGPSDNEMTSNSAGKPQIQNGGDINSALSDLESMQNVKNDGVVSKSAVKDIGQQVTKQVSKLDQILMQADRAQSSLNHQNKQLSTMLRKK